MASTSPDRLRMCNMPVPDYTPGVHTGRVEIALHSATSQSDGIRIGDRRPANRRRRAAISRVALIDCTGTGYMFDDVHFRTPSHRIRTRGRPSLAIVKWVFGEHREPCVVAPPPMSDDVSSSAGGTSISPSAAASRTWPGSRSPATASYQLRSGRRRRRGTGWRC